MPHTPQLVAAVQANEFSMREAGGSMASAFCTQMFRGLRFGSRSLGGQLHDGPVDCVRLLGGPVDARRLCTAGATAPRRATPRSAMRGDGLGGAAVVLGWGPDPHG
jgi:hypothetical protein